MGKAAIVVDRLHIGLHGSPSDIVNDVSFSIAPGEVLGLVGESGSGKTTVGLALLGHARRGAEIKGGSVRIGDIEVLELDPAERARLRGRLRVFDRGGWSRAYCSHDHLIPKPW